MSTEALLSRLDGVKRTGPNRWLARCPAHADRSPSLAVRELDGGRVLIHCFAGCGVEAILSAAGLDFDALFPARPIEDGKRVHRPFSPLEALRCVAFEATLAAVAASNVAQGVPMSEEERARLHTAAVRISHALDVALGQ
jgi:hypothetical protein